MEDYAYFAIIEINRQWNNGINIAFYNGKKWYKNGK